MRKKQKIIIFIIIFLLIFSAIAIFAFYKKKLKQAGTPQTKILQEEERLDDYDLGKKARKEHNIEYCYKLKSGDPDQCVYVVANYNNDKELCGKIQNEDIKKECYEYFMYQEIISKGNVNDCPSLTVDKFNKQCLSNFFWQWDNTDKCANFKGAEKSDCEDIINKKAAYKNNDIKLCDSIKNSALSADCKKIIANKPKDSDNDGLLDSEERSYGTNPFEADSDFDGLNDLEEMSKYFTDPNNPDTDGDGYSDGEEVKAGYNPKEERGGN